jgi:ParB/RepB/Spo0J family partition protein
LKLPSDFAKKVAESLGITARGVDQLFDFSEDKQGFFVARLKPQQFLDKKDQFRTMCALVRDLGGEEYLKGAMAWKVPGPFVKKTNTTSTPGPAGDARSKTSEQTMDRQPTYKGPGNAMPAGPSGVTPRSVTDDKSRPPQTTVPLKALLSMPFQCRTNPDDPEMAELTESIKAMGVLQPILVRPKPNGLYEIVYGQRRARAAEKAGLVEVPVTIRFLSDEEAFTLQLTENLQRKDLSEEEKARALGELAKRTGWNAQQIADKLKMSYAWVCRYLPEEFKTAEKVEAGRIGGEVLKQRYEEEAALRRRAESQDTRQGIPPSVTSPQEIRRAAQPEQLSESLGPQPESEESPKPLLTGFEVECPECHMKLLINHVDHPNGKVSHEVEE